MKASHTVGIAILLVTVIPATAMALPFEFGGKAGFESFKWQEFDKSGQQTADEQGTRTTLSGFLHSKPGTGTMPHFLYGVEFKVYSGSTDYRDNNPQNANRDFRTDWSGGSFEGEAGVRAGRLPFAWDFSGKLGFDVWTRTMDDALDVSTRDVQAEEQEYSVLNLRLGTGPAWQAGNWLGQARIGIKLPLAASVIIRDKKSNYDNNSDDQLDFSLDGKITPYFTLSNQIRLTNSISMKIDAYYDAYKFKRSGTKTTDTDNNNTTNVNIPESKQFNYGIQGGVSIDF